MKTYKSIFILSGLIALIAVLHLCAVRFNLYFAIWWFDLVMHFLGGLWCALFALSCVARHRVRTGKVFTVGAVYCTAILGALSIGLLWEVYEYIFGLTFTAKSSYALDTELDVIMDVIGSLVAALKTKRSLIRSV